MEKTSVKTSPRVHKKLIQARQSINWIKAELESLPELYEGKKQAKLARFKNKLNKQLSSAAFKACDKGEYYDGVIDSKLMRYDVKKYMAHRALNHGTAKRIFGTVKLGQSYDEILSEQYAKYQQLNAARAEYKGKLTEKKAAFVEKHGAADATEYNALIAKKQAEYDEYEAKLTAAYGAAMSEKAEKLSQKLKGYESLTEQLSAKTAGGLKLEEGVLLSVRDLKMYFGGLKAVDGLSFDVKKGEIFGLIGPNGAGKTTVFNCITRFYDATGGDMYFENKYGEVVDMRSFKVHDVILQGISRTFQNVELIKEISVVDNLLVACTREYKTGIIGQALGLPSLKKEEKLLRAKAMKILKFMGIESYAAWYAMGLPYGILKKVEIARALMCDAKLIIMDEPAAGLNDSETADLTRTIRRIRDEFGVTILLVEHDMSLVMNVCDTVCAISFGRMLAIGTTDEIKKNKAVQEAYLGVDEEEEAQPQEEAEGNE